MGCTIGSSEIAPAPDLLVAEAVAASSAFPIAFPPLVLKLRSERRTRGGTLQKSNDRSSRIFDVESSSLMAVSTTTWD